MATRYSLLFGLILFLPAAVMCGSDNPDGRQIMDIQQSRHQLPLFRDSLVMMLIDRNGGKTIREITQYGKTDPAGLRQNLVVFTSPSDLRGTTLVTREYEKNTFKQWLYLPGSSALQRIASKARRTAFMGSDFTYEDMLPDTADNYDFTRLPDETVDGEDCFVVDMLPRDPEIKKVSSYGRRRFWVRKDIYFTLKVQFFDRRDNRVKTQTCHDLKPLGKTAWYAGKILMDNHEKQHQTVMGIRQKQIDLDLEDSLFSEKSILGHKHL